MFDEMCVEWQLSGVKFTAKLFVSSREFRIFVSMK